jgi:hypothetical protein
MSAPSVTFTIQQSNLGQTGAGGQKNMIVVVGDSSSGTANQPYQSPVPGNFVTQAGYGQGPQLAALLAARSGKTVGFVKAAAVTPGANTAVYARTNVTTGTANTSTSAITLTGAPFDDYYGLVTVVVGGTIGITGIQLSISLDNGRTTLVTANLLTASTYAISSTNTATATGLTLNFGAGTLVAGDTFTWASVAPAPSDATVTCAIQSLIGKGWDIEDILVVTPSNATNATARDTDCTTLFGKKIFQRLLTTARDATYGGTCTENETTWMSSLESNFASFVSTRVGVTAGYYNSSSPIDGVNYRRPLLFAAGVRDSVVAISVDLARVKDGPLAPLVIPTLPDAQWSPAGQFIYHDEYSDPGLDGARFITATSIPGFPGMYITNPNLMAQPSSDFELLQFGHVIDKFCKILYAFFANELSDSVRVSSSTGFILDADASNLEHQCQAAIDAGLVSPGDVSAASVAITRNNNILSTKELIVTGLVVPLAYLKSIPITVAFQNPTIQQVGG